MRHPFLCGDALHCFGHAPLLAISWPKPPIGFLWGGVGFALAIGFLAITGPKLPSQGRRGAVSPVGDGHQDGQTRFAHRDGHHSFWP
jgi:hypothetical protein